MLADWVVLSDAWEVAIPILLMVYWKVTPVITILQNHPSSQDTVHCTNTISLNLMNLKGPGCS